MKTTNGLTRALSPRSWALAALATAALAGAAHGQAFLYQGQFEGTDGGWVESGFGDWERGPLGTYVDCADDGTEPHGLTPPAGAGGGMWATILDGCHSNPPVSQGSIISQTFNCLGWTSLNLKWAEYLDAGVAGFDFARVRVNGVQIYQDDDLASGWREIDIDISAAADNNTTVLIEFEYFASTVVAGAGWYVDNIRLEGNPPGGPGVDTRILAFTDSGDPTCTGGDTVSYSVQYANFGNDPATGVQVNIPVPVGTSFVSGDPGVVFNGGLNRVELPVGNLASLGGATFGYVLDLPDTAGDYVMTATITRNEVDTNPANDSANQTTTVIAGGSLANDACAGASALSGTGSLFSGTVANTCAGDDAAPGGCSAEPSTYGGVWYAFTPVNNGVLVCAETGAQNVVWALHADCSGSTIECNLNDTSSFILAGGQPYLILVGAETAATDRSAALNLAISFNETPANDACSGATDLGTVGSFPTSPITITQSNIAATDEADGLITCNTGSSFWGGVWYTYTATAPGALSISENGAQDTVLAYAKNSSCDPAAFDACTSTDAGPLWVTLNTGESVLIVVAATASTTSRIENLQTTFTWFGTLPANDNCSTATNLGGVGMLPSTTVNATVNNRAAQNDVDIGTCNTGSSAWGGVWYTFTNSTGSGGAITFTETGNQDVVWAWALDQACDPTTWTCSSTDTGLSAVVPNGSTITLMVSAASLTMLTRDNDLALSFGWVTAPANDECAGAVDLGTLASPYTIVESNAAAGDDQDIGTCNTGSSAWGGVWYTFVAPSNGAIVATETGGQDVVWAVATGASCAGPFTWTCNATDTSFITQVTSGTRYYWLLSATATTTVRTALAGSFTFFPAPANDTCANATDLGSLTSGVRIMQSNLGAQNDLDSGTCNTGSSSWGGVWFTFTAPAAGTLYFSETAGQDVVWAVFSDCSATVSTVCDAADADRTRILANGQTVKLLVSALATGTARTTALDMTFGFFPNGTPPNDTCATAKVISTTPFIDVANAPLATDDATPSCSTNAAILGGVWYSFTSPYGGSLLIEELTSQGVLIASYTGDCMTPTQNSCTLAESTTLPITAGTTYRILVGNEAASAPTGPFATRFTFTPATGGCCDGANCSIITEAACDAISGSTYLGDNSTCANPFVGGTEFNTGTTLPVVIADNANAVATVVISGSGVTLDADGIAVKLGLTHTFIGDLDITISNGTVTAFVMSDANSSDSSELDGIYRFYDTAPSFIAAAAATAVDVDVTPGDYAPSNQNAAVSFGAAFAGQPLDGTWTITVGDDAAGDTGTLTAFSVREATFGAPPCNTGPTPCQIADFDNMNGVDVVDLFAFLDAWFAETGVCMSNCSSDISLPTGSPDVTDLFDYLDLWFFWQGTNPCP